jgi:hypothetical protein
MKEFATPASKYGASTTTAEVIPDLDMHGRRVLVTGAAAHHIATRQH